MHDGSIGNKQKERSDSAQLCVSAVGRGMGGVEGALRRGHPLEEDLEGRHGLQHHADQEPVGRRPAVEGKCWPQRRPAEGGHVDGCESRCGMGDGISPGKIEPGDNQRFKA